MGFRVSGESRSRPLGVLRENVRERGTKRFFVFYGREKRGSWNPMLTHFFNYTNNLIIYKNINKELINTMFKKLTNILNKLTNKK